MADQPLNNIDPKKEIEIPAQKSGVDLTPPEHPENIPDRTDALVDDTSDGTNTHMLDVDTELKGAVGGVAFSKTSPKAKADVPTPAPTSPSTAPLQKPAENPAVPFVQVPPKIMPPPPPPLLSSAPTILPHIQADEPVPPTPTPKKESGAPISLNPEVIAKGPIIPNLSSAQTQTAPPPPTSPLKGSRSFASLTPLMMPAPVAPPENPPQAVFTRAERAIETPKAEMPAAKPFEIAVPFAPPPSPPTDRPTPGMIAPILPNVKSDPKDKQKRGLFVPPQPPKPVAPPPSPKLAEQPKPKLSPLEQLRAMTASPLHPIRTFKMDAQDTVKDQNASIITMVAAEQQRLGRTTVAPQLSGEAPKHHYVRTVLLAIASVALFAGGVGAIAFILIPQTVSPPPEVQTSNLIYIDQSSELAIAGLDHGALMSLLTELRDKTGLSLGLMREIYFTVPTNDGGKRLATIGEFMPKLATNIPPLLLRSLDAQYLVGVHVYDGNQGFIILKTSAYEQAYSGMLAWEPYMQSDLLPFMDRRPSPRLSRDIRATSTPARVINSSFVDAVVQNHDARVLYNDNGDIVLLYSFIDRDTLVIATNDKTLLESIVRVSQ